jgi:pimeloyl-ACP methyl ester carboxylesterase
LAYEITGAGVPVVFLHGLTFDRRMWRPVVERLDGSVRSILIDLPAHGESGGPPAPLEEVAAQLHQLLEPLGVVRPILVGHSMSVALAFLYAGAYGAAGIVAVDQGLDVRPFAALVSRLEPQLRGEAFAQAWQPFEDSLGLDQIPEPQRSLAYATHRVEQSVVVGYWQQLMQADPTEFQAWIDVQLARWHGPCLAVFGRPVTEAERHRFAQTGDCQIEEWLGKGHCVHLVELDRFAAALRRFIEQAVTVPATEPA